MPFTHAERINDETSFYIKPKCHRGLFAMVRLAGGEKLSADGQGAVLRRNQRFGTINFLLNLCAVDVY
jgi:hypothetical protein